MRSDLHIGLPFAVAVIRYLMLAGALSHLLGSYRNRDLFGPHNLLGWETVRSFSDLPAGHPLFRLFAFTAAPRGFLLLQAVQCALLLFLASGLTPGLAAGLSGGVFAAQLAVNFRLRPVMNAPLQMRLMIYGGLFFYDLGPDEATQRFALGFIAFQSLASYLFPGLLRLGSAPWRDGTALPFVISAEAHGRRPAWAAWLRARPRWSAALSWAVLVFECLMPFLIFLGPEGALAFILAGTAFHLVNAAVLGFADFIPVFLAPYPALLYISGIL